MRTADLISRVEDLCPGFEMVDHALTSTAEEVLPAALITPSKTEAQGDSLFGLGIHSQIVTQTFSIFVLLRRAQDTNTTSKADDLDDLTDQLRAALAGWQLDGDHSPMILVGGMLDKFHTGVVCWREDYSTETELRVTR
ncbi:MAG: phage tail terminator protein [Cypionkella sp.]